MIKHEFYRYDDYKETDSPWFDKAPLHWINGRIKDFTDTNATTKIPTNLNDNDLIEFIPMTNVNDDLGKIKQFNFLPLKELSTGYTKFKNGDVIFAKITPCMENGNCAIVNGLSHNICFGSTEFIVFRAYQKLIEKYLHYFLHNELFRRNAEPFMKGTAGQKRISNHYLSTHYFALPPLPEQETIADYLDTKTAQIDRKIDLLSQKATKYGELKKSLINETVIRGLDKTVAMKDSGIEWIGNTPEHWQIERIGTAFDERSQKVSDTDYPPLSVSMGGIVPQMNSVAKTDNNENRKRVAVGDYVINSRSDRRGASGISIYDGSVTVISIVLSPRQSFFGKYLHHLFRSYRFVEEFYRVGRGIVDDLWTTRYSVMKAIEFAYPPYEEQKTISDYLDTKTAYIDRIVETINTQIDKLKELRKTLINDVVTGKIKVTVEGEAA